MGSSKNTVIPPGFQVTRLPASNPDKKLRSVYSLLKEEERALELGYSGRVEMAKERVKQRIQKAAAAIDINALPEHLRHLVPPK